MKASFWVLYSSTGESLGEEKKFGDATPNVKLNGWMDRVEMQGN